MDRFLKPINYPYLVFLGGRWHHKGQTLQL